MLKQFDEAWSQLAEKLIGWFNAAILGLPNFILALLIFPNLAVAVFMLVAGPSRPNDQSLSA